MAVMVPLVQWITEQPGALVSELVVRFWLTSPPATLAAASKHRLSLVMALSQAPLVWVLYTCSIFLTILSVQGHSSSPLYAASLGAAEAWIMNINEW